MDLDIFQFSEFHGVGFTTTWQRNGNSNFQFRFSFTHAIGKRFLFSYYIENVILTSVSGFLFSRNFGQQTTNCHFFFRLSF